MVNSKIAISRDKGENLFLNLPLEVEVRGEKVFLLLPTYSEIIKFCEDRLS